MQLAAKSADDILQRICQKLLTEGRPIAPRGRSTIEICPLSFTLTNPRARRISNPHRHWSESLAVGELCWHLSASNEAEFIGYYARKWTEFSDDGRTIAGSCYGRKLFGGTPGSSPWSLVRKELRTDRNSRRAVLTIGETDRDLRGPTKDVPCATAMQLLVRGGALDCIVYMRSNDVIWGLCYDLYLFTMLQERMAVELGVRLGAYTHIAGSMHVYEEFLPMAREIAASPGSAAASPMPPMGPIAELDDFLALERELRLHPTSEPEGLHRLGPYWRALAAPLLNLSRTRRRRSRERDAALTGA